MICRDYTTLGSLLVNSPGLMVVKPESSTLLGSPIGGAEGLDSILGKKIDSLHVLGERLSYLHAHDALHLRQHAFSIPKLLYTLRSSPSFSFPLLHDRLQGGLVSEIVNVDLNDSAWTQASLPVHLGGFGIRRAVQLAPSAFLAPAAACSNLIHQIFPEKLTDVQCSFQDDALDMWSQIMKLHPLKELSPFGDILG